MFSHARLRAALLLALAPLLSGCLSSTTSITLERSGAGSLGIDYEIDHAAWETGVFDESDVARPIPVTEREFRRAAEMIDGLDLERHRVELPDRSDAEPVVRVRTRLRFDSTDALRRFLGVDSVTVEQDGGHGQFRMVVARGDGAASAQELARSLERYSLRFELDPPAAIVEDTGRTLEGGDRSQFDVSLADIVLAEAPIVWEVRW
ncbi:MAG: hypothetical protein ACOC1I_03710 [Spirochaetota bacterium]